MPFRSGHIPATGPFQILDMGEGMESLVLYKETYLRDEMIYDEDEINIHLEVFDELSKRALSETKSQKLILAEAAVLRASAAD